MTPEGLRLLETFYFSYLEFYTKPVAWTRSTDADIVEITDAETAAETDNNKGAAYLSNASKQLKSSILSRRSWAVRTISPMSRLLFLKYR